MARIGTSYDELRLARRADPEKRKALADRLGIALTSDSASVDGGQPTDMLDALLLDPRAAPPDVRALTEEKLEDLFGLADTNRDGLAPGSRSKLETSRLAYLCALWRDQDWPSDPYNTGELHNTDWSFANFAETA